MKKTEPAGAGAARLLRGLLGQRGEKLTYAEYLWTPGWRRRRQAALDRAGRRCELCGEWRQLHVHHLTYERLGDELPTDLVVLCKYCHQREHGKIDPGLDKYLLYRLQVLARDGDRL